MKEYLFVGETRSQTAKDKNWTWEDGRLAAKQLFDALKELGINPEEQEFQNLWDDDGNMLDVESEREIVGMGNKVSEELDRRGIKHIKIVHPAARGKIRSKEVYTNHLRERL